MSENMLDNLYDCLLYLGEIMEYNKFNNDDLKILSNAYDIIKCLYLNEWDNNNKG